MVAEPLQENASLAEILGARARRTPVDRLAIDVVGGAIIAGAALWARPAGWVVIFAAAVCFLGYGLWALADRRLHSVEWPERVENELLWETVHSFGALVGLLAFGALLFACLGVALGTIIS